MSKEDINKGSKANIGKNGINKAVDRENEIRKDKKVLRDLMAEKAGSAGLSVEEIAESVRLAPTDQSNRRKVEELLKKLKAEGEVENRIRGGILKWRLTSCGLLHHENSDDDYERILEANFVHCLIKGKVSEKKNKDATPQSDDAATRTKKPESQNNDAATRTKKPESQSKDTSPHTKDRMSGEKNGPQGIAVPVGYNVRRDTSPDLLSVDKHRVHSITGELREAVVIPPEFGSRTLENDIEKGAYLFKPLLKLTDSDIGKKVTVIRATSIEYAMKAASYIALKQNAMDEVDEEDIEAVTDSDSFELENYDPVDEASYSNVLPVTNVEDMVFDNVDTVSFDMGSLNLRGAGRVLTRTPYWMNHRGAMIILNTTGHLFRNEETLSDAIGRVFHNKRHIFVIDIESESRFVNEDEEFSIPTGKQDCFMAILKYNATCIDIAPIDDSPYINTVLSGLCEKYGIAIPADYPKKDLIMRLKKTVNDFRTTTLEQLVIREADRGSRELSMETLKLLGCLSRGEKDRLKGWELLASMEGMESVKEEVHNLINAMKLNKARKKKGLKCEPVVGVLFAGPPGVGKSTVGQAVADILKDEQLLPGGRFTSISGSNLQAQYVGETSFRVRSLADGADVLLIDECYSLSQSFKYKSPYAAEALAELCLLLSEAAERSDKLYIFAGYGGTDSTEDNNLMKMFLNSNPGIKSRISTVIDFPSYNAEHMGNVFMKICDNVGYVFDEADVPSLKSDIEAYFSERITDPSFGNGREARNLVSEAMRIHSKVVDGKDLDDITDEELKTITVDEIRAAISSLRMMEQARAGKKTRKISLIG